MARGDARHTRLLESSKAHQLSQFRLTVVDGPDAGSHRDSTGVEFAIGSSEANDLVLGDPAVSRHHCAIEVAAAGCLITDLGSTNGTRVAGLQIERAYLPPGAIIEIGATRLRFELTEDAIAESLADHGGFDRLIGDSVAMRRIFAIVDKISKTEATVLIEGETGTGKTLLAEAIHRRSARAAGPFVVVDCGAIAPTLIESELFGHEKGAFTGAVSAHVGAFEAAAGGTAFLDEIAELPLDLQPKLLRAIENRTVKRVGASAPVALDIRLIAASNRDLRQAVNQERFRSDLFYRLNTIRLRVPPLRERREDIPALVAHFYAQFAGDPEPPPELIEQCFWHPWPGNVRELRAAVERTVLLADPALVAELDPAAADAAEPDFDPRTSYRAAKEKAVRRFERRFVRELIHHHAGNLSAAARAASMDRTHLRELLRRHKIAIPGRE